MRHITKINVFHIISEPGDKTRYDYLVHQVGPDDFTIAPAGGTLEYPQRLNYFDAVKILETDDVDLKFKEAWNGISPYTLKDACRTVMEIHDGLSCIE